MIFFSPYTHYLPSLTTELHRYFSDILTTYERKKPYKEKNNIRPTKKKNTAEIVKYIYFFLFFGVCIFQETFSRF